MLGDDRSRRDVLKRDGLSLEPCYLANNCGAWLPDNFKLDNRVRYGVPNSTAPRTDDDGYARDVSRNAISGN